MRKQLYATVNVDVYGIDSERASSKASAFRQGYFTADSDTLVTISVDHYLSLTLSTDYMGEWVSGYAEAGLRLENKSASDSNEDTGHLSDYVFDGDLISDWYESPLTLEASIPFSAGDVGFFKAWVYNEVTGVSVIPEPATILLLGSGLAGMFGLRRKPAV